MIKKIFAALLIFGFVNAKAQDTFSILAFDSISGEVGGAGASCVDLFQTTFNNHFIVELFPGEGAVACQGAFIPGNQTNARNRFNAGDSPKQLISWLKANDIFSDPSERQYGVVRMMPDSVKSAAYTGSGCQNYRNHILGPNYSIHGNILRGSEVLDSMEARFLREPGDLACKLMAAMQGAKMVGADSRCAANGSSSLFAFLKVTQPSDSFGNPAFLVSVRTHSNAGLEPIDSLQVLFSQVKSCVVNTAGLPAIQSFPAKIFPQPANDRVIVESNRPVACRVLDLTGRERISGTFAGTFELNTGSWPNGVYLLELRCSEGIRTGKIVVNH